MRITADFVGGNIVAAQTDENRFLLSCDLREWAQHPMVGLSLVCVPIVDYDGGRV